MTSFADQIGAWADETEARTTAVYRRSVEMLGEEMTKTKPQGGRVPIDTGNLSRSVLASTAAMPKTSETPAAGSNVGAVAATLRTDQTVWIGWTSIYSWRQNYGFVGADSLGRVYNQAGNYFLEGAISEWQNIVNRAAAEIQKSVKGDK